MILVTGAGGTVGSEVVLQLKAAGAKFRAGYHSEAKAKEARAKGIDAAVIDFERPETLRDALGGVDKVFLLSGSASNQSDREINLVDAAKAAGVTHIVKLSVFGAAEEKFLLSKPHRAVEKAIEASGLKWTFLRPNGFMQNMKTYNGATIESQGAFYSTMAGARVSHVDVRDIAAVAVKTLTSAGHEGKSYDLTGPEALTNDQMAEIVARKSGKPVRYVNLSDADLRSGMTAAGVPGDYAGGLLDLYRYYREGNNAALISGDIKKVLGRDPINFNQYVNETF